MGFYKRKAVLAATLVFIMIITAACVHQQTKNEYNLSGANILVKEEVAPVSMTSYTRSDYSVFFEGECERVMLEPEKGCYIGVYSAGEEAGLSAFDKAAGKKHALAVRIVRLGEEFPYDFLLECAAEMKTPYIIVNPQNSYNFFNTDILEKTAKEFGSFPMPVFIDFYPNPRSYTNNPGVYAQFYRKARSEFAKHAPNAVFVASVNSKDVYDFDLFYPGDEYVDWVGIIMYQPLYMDGDVNLRNYSKDLEFLCANFQHKKPVIISQLAFSFYSTVDHRYVTKEAARKLAQFYENVESGIDCSRVKAVNYMDLNEIPGAPKKAERDNYSITQDETLMTAYREAVSGGYFLSETRDNAGLKELFRSYFTVYEDENFKYVSESALIAEGVFPDGGSVIINGQVYYSIEELSKIPQIDYMIDDKIKRIIIKLK